MRVCVCVNSTITGREVGLSVDESDAYLGRLTIMSSSDLFSLLHMGPPRSDAAATAVEKFYNLSQFPHLGCFHFWPVSKAGIFV